MPRYFFDVKDGRRSVDPAGLELSSQQEALGFAQELAARLAAESNNNIGRRVVVIDIEGQEVLSVLVTNTAPDQSVDP